MNNLTRICTKCGKELPVTPKCFYRKKLGKYGFMAECKKCNELRRKGMIELLPKANEGYKICRKCDRELPATLEYFYKKNTTIDGLRCQCKKCEVQQSVTYSKTPHGKESKSKSRIKHYESNREYILTKNSEWRLKNPEKWREIRRKAKAKHEREMELNKLFTNPFDESEKVDWHHIDDEHVVALPTDLHRIYLGKRHRDMCLVIVKQIYGDMI